ncbi:MAG: hypothetical protein PVF27_03335 [Gemmatimonadales bacterium]|jgi:hypothetical protein
MPQSREFQCSAKSFTLTLYDDGVIGIFDSTGKLFLGWPETTVLEPDKVMDKANDEICEQLAQLRKL